MNGKIDQNLPALQDVSHACHALSFLALSQKGQAVPEPDLIASAPDPAIWYLASWAMQIDLCPW